ERSIMSVVHLTNVVSSDQITQSAREWNMSSSKSFQSNTRKVQGNQDSARRPRPQVPGNQRNRFSQTSKSLLDGTILLPYGSVIDQPAAERIRILRATIERTNLDANRKQVLAVTSAIPGEGKSLTA